MAWTVKVTDEYAAWFTALIKQDLDSATQVAQAVAALREEGPTLGRPLVDRLKATKIHHLKELRPGSKGRSEIRIIFAFDPTRSALLLLGGDKAGNWARWYRATSRWPNSSTSRRSSLTTTSTSPSSTGRFHRRPASASPIASGSSGAPSSRSSWSKLTFDAAPSAALRYRGLNNAVGMWRR